MGSLPKVKKKNFPKSVNEMSKEMLQETLKKKKECNAKALEIVEKLCEASVDENWFLENLQFINQCHFDDVTVERSILKMCGYPLCREHLQNVPVQQYHISTRYNKVFDIKERKNFCSSCCYKSAIHVKKQLFTSPLWFRDQEVIPKYTLLKSKSSMGEEVEIFPDKIKLDPEDMKNKSKKKAEVLDLNVSNLIEEYSKLKIDNFYEPQNVNQYADDKIPKNKEDANTSQKEVNENNDLSEKYSVAKESLNKNFERDKINVTNESSCSNVEEVKYPEDFKKDKTNVTSESSCKNDEKVESIKKTQRKDKRDDKPLDTISKVEKCVFEWFSLDTLFYLYGEEKVKGIFSENTDEIKKVLNSKLSMANFGDKIDQMIHLYGLLDAGLFSEKEGRTNLKPLPDYTALKDERDTVQIKVRAFYQGNLELKQAPKEEEKKKEEKETVTDDEAVYLPLVDAHAQIPHRRKILLDKLIKVFPDLMKIFTSEYNLQMNEVRNLISTFTLSAHNITFKPSEWHLVGIVIIKLLTLQDKVLECVMKSSNEQILLILSNYGLPEDYLDNLIVRLTNSKNLLKKLNEINT